jgi:hypothetical protein
MKPLPCPFCGHTGIVKNDRDRHGDGWLVECPNPNHATGPEGCFVTPRTIPFISEAAAIEAWNERRPYIVNAGGELQRRTDAELLNAALPWVEELLRRSMLGVMISIPPTAITPPKIAQDFPAPENYQVMDDHLLLFAAYSPDDAIDDPEIQPLPANSSRKLRPQD